MKADGNQPCFKNKRCRFPCDIPSEEPSGKRNVVEQSAELGMNGRFLFRFSAIRNPSGEIPPDYMQPGPENLRRVRSLPAPISEEIAGSHIVQ